MRREVETPVVQRLREAEHLPGQAAAQYLLRTVWVADLALEPRPAGGIYAQVAVAQEAGQRLAGRNGEVVRAGPQVERQRAGRLVVAVAVEGHRHAGRATDGAALPVAGQG